MLLNVPGGDLPSAHGVALLTVCTELAFVDIGMAILAALSDVGKYGPDVTFRAGDRGMHTPEWILGLVVIKFWDGADRLPCVGSVAVLAG